MILNEEQKKKFVLSQDPETGEWLYDLKLYQKKFSREFFGDWMSFFTNIIMFNSPLKIAEKRFDNCLTIIGEIQNTNSITGVAIQRLYSYFLGSLITEYTNQECNLNENTLFFNGRQLSFVSTKQVNGSIIFHIFISLSETNDEQLSFLPIKKVKLDEFKQKAYDGYYHLTRSLFFESQQT